MRFFDLFSSPQDDRPPDGEPQHHEPDTVAPGSQSSPAWTPTEYLAIRRLRMRREREAQAEREAEERERRRHTFARYLYQTGRIGEGLEAGGDFAPHE